jgi:hypothetical protein
MGSTDLFDRSRRRPFSSGALAACVAFLLLLPASAPLAAQTLKMATLAPQGSIWDLAIRSMGERWTRDTAGRVQLRVYAGGVAGDESDALRKVRAGQFQGLAITVAGLTEIDTAFNVFQIPMYFESFEELDYVLGELRSRRGWRRRATFCCIGDTAAGSTSSPGSRSAPWPTSSSRSSSSGPATTAPCRPGRRTATSRCRSPPPTSCSASRPR